MTKAGYILFITACFAGCASTPPPIQEMSDARQSVEAAHIAGADKLAPSELNSAETLLSEAESGIRSGDFDKAQKDALAAKEAAQEALAISAEQIPPEPDLEKLSFINKPKAPPPVMTYTIHKGDNLWSLASRNEIYGDPSLWPLILKTNAEIIDNADVIQPGQTLTIELEPSTTEQTEAKLHARKRLQALTRWQRQSLDNRYLQNYGLR